MEAENWLLVFGVVLAIGLLAKLGIHLIESSVGRGIFPHHLADYPDSRGKGDI